MVANQFYVPIAILALYLILQYTSTLYKFHCIIVYEVQTEWFFFFIRLSLLLFSGIVMLATRYCMF